MQSDWKPVRRGNALHSAPPSVVISLPVSQRRTKKTVAAGFCWDLGWGEGEPKGEARFWAAPHTCAHSSSQSRSCLGTTSTSLVPTAAAAAAAVEGETAGRSADHSVCSPDF
uniref:Uncharacterized protein n=1 Tax=Chromera velia CCMP2878 TaxID=1169474 RepID=A0A0G4FXF1_9ALVE|eukprot:Cvel_19151.t1-p1 / transcript=Cvel_19151.t1 / gene=Cvel_19151 / organism=Chromera_velia_CCMP2878 / gene_product=hypothetical protein / transcript_product=hypothetical protein / location=Cvel_scaffold1630:2287-2619(-) / protein_length=111 / sequence_SO=supercontig / SO=protein_coding / is_pseudo=false